MIKSLKFKLLIAALTVVFGCATTGKGHWKLSEVSPRFRSYEQTDLDPLKGKKIPKSPLNYRKYDDFFDRGNRLIIMVDFALNLIQEIDKKRKSGQSPVEETGALLTIHSMLPELQKEGELLTRQGKTLLTSAKNDFGGRQAYRLPEATRSLTATLEGLKSVIEKFPAIARKLTGLASGQGEVPSATAKAAETEAASQPPKEGVKGSQKQQAEGRSRALEGTERKKEGKAPTDGSKADSTAGTKPAVKPSSATKTELATEANKAAKAKPATETDATTKTKPAMETDATTKTKQATEADTAAKNKPVPTASGSEDPDIEPNLPMEDQGNGSISYGTELLWQKCSYGQRESSCSGKPEPQTWRKAVRYCQKLGLLGGKWRLPTIKELRVILDREKQKGARIRMARAFSSTRQDVYWSSSPYQNDVIAIWVVDFSTGLIFPYGSDYPGYTRCVSDQKQNAPGRKTKNPSPTTGHAHP